jgi:catechol 2,3-dioxygenase-like lactoylglutathione lyase family enzyme
MAIERIIENLLRDFELGKMSRRRLIQSLAFTAGATSAAGAMTKIAVLGLGPINGPNGMPIKAIGVNHISIESPDHAKQAAFYGDLLGLPVVDDKPGISSLVKVGETTLIFQDLGVRKEAQGVKHGTNQPGVDHISYTIADWDENKEIENAVAAELKRRGLPVAKGQRPGKSTHFTVKDPIGLGLEVGGKVQL